MKTILITILCATTVVSAQSTYNWTNPGTGNWTDTNNWDTGVLPLITDYAYIDNGGTVAITEGDESNFRKLYLGLESFGHLEMTGGTINISSDNGSGIDVSGIGGTSTFTMSGGVVNAVSHNPDIRVGTTSDSSGYVLFSGNAVFNGYGNTSQTALLVGTRGTGKVEIKDDAQVLFENGAGIIGGGRVTIQDKDGQGSYVADETTKTGNGTLILSGNARLTQNPVMYSMYVGTNARGRIELHDNATLEAYPGIELGKTTEGYGEFIMNSGTVISGSIDVGREGEGYLEINGGTIDINKNTSTNLSAFLYIGYYDTAVGTMKMTGGTVNVNGPSDPIKAGFYVGLYGEGNLELGGGTINVMGMTSIGWDKGSTGNAVISGTGELHGTQHIIVGQNGKGSLDVENGGKVNADGVMAVGWGSGDGTLNINKNGEVHTKGTFIVGNTTGTGAVVNLNEGGLLETVLLQQKAAQSDKIKFVFDGGVLKADDLTDDSEQFVQNLNFTLNAKGGTIDTNSKEIKINTNFSGVGQLLKDGAGSLTLSGNSTFEGGISIATGGVMAASENGLGAGTTIVSNGTWLDSSVSNSNAGGIILEDGALLRNNGAGAGSYTLSGDDFRMEDATYELTIIDVNLFDKIKGDGANYFFLNDGQISLSGNIDYTAQYHIFENFLIGTVGNVDVTGYDTANWTHHIETNGILWFDRKMPIPEPSVYAMLFGTFAFTLRRRKR